MNSLNPTSKNLMFVLFFVLLTLSSCGKDNDLFLEAIGEDIAQNETETPTEETETPTDGTDSVNNPTDQTAVITTDLPDFINDTGNDIPLNPSNPNRIIYVAVNGSSSNDGLSESKPINIDKAFDKSFVQAGDVFYIKAGEYTYGLNPSNGRQYDLSNIPCTPDKPCYWIGYKNSPGDINASQFSTVTWDDYKSRPVNAYGNHDLDETDMPTFSGSTANTPSYIDNESLFWQDGGEQGFVFRNIQIQYFRYAFEFRNISNSVFENVVVANLGKFEYVAGQGGSNQELIGKAFSITQNSNHNKVLNCATYNMAMTGFSLGEGEYNLVAFSEATSDIDNGNPQDYYFHSIGKYNWFNNLRANRLISSNHSGHGICFNQLAQFNVASQSRIYGTSFHLDGASNCFVKDIDVIGDPSYGLYKGGNISLMDNADNNIIVDVRTENGESSISFNDSGGNSYEEAPGKNNHFIGLTSKNTSLGVINLARWNEIDDPTEDNIFEDCVFSDSPYLFVVSRANSGFQLINCSLENIEKIEENTYKNTAGYVLNSNTQFINCNFWNGEVPSSSLYEVTGATERAPN